MRVLSSAGMAFPGFSQVEPDVRRECAMVTIEHFSRLVHEIYDAAVDPSHWTVALEQISAAVGATGCALLTTEPAHSEITVRSSGAEPASVTTYNDYFGAIDPSPAALKRVPTGLVIPNE